MRTRPARLRTGARPLDKLGVSGVRQAPAAHERGRGARRYFWYFAFHSS